MASGLRPGPAALEPSEADLRVRHVPLAAAVEAVRGGLVRCAASALLIRTLAADWDLATGRRRPIGDAARPDSNGGSDP